MNKNRGMFLESLINRTISFYWKNKLCVIHKKNLDIVFKTIIRNKDKLKIHSGFVSKKSTVDYYGVFKSVFIAFEAKSTNLNALPLSNIASHQQEYLDLINFHGGLGFYIICFKELNRYFLIRSNNLDKLKVKSINIIYLKKYGVEIEITYPGIIDFLHILENWI